MAEGEYRLPEPDELEEIPADEFECPCGCTDRGDGDE